jgi:predicted MPP superfamily phosphohydrolase
LLIVAGLFLTFFPPFVTYRWAVGAFPWLARRRKKLIIGFVAFALCQTALYWILVRTHSRVVAGVHLATVIASVTLALTSVALAALLVVSRGLPWAFRRARGQTARDAPLREAGPMTRRQVIEGATGAALYAGTAGMLGWGMARGRHEYRLIEIAVRIPGLPRALDGYVVAQVSDIHAGDFVGPKDLDAGLALVREARPDLVVVTGDLVDFDPAFAPLVARKLADTAPRDGVVASLGNHDYYSGARAVDAALRSAGIDVLVNAGKVIRPRDRGGFALLGVSDMSAWRHGGPRPDLERALAMVPQDLPRILLSHQPQTIDKWPGRVALQLSGHTHGGQINPGNAFLGPFFEYIAGEYSVHGTTLYVNRGLGTVGPPARVGVPPEVTRIVLVAG